MKRILRLIIVLFIGFICITAYVNSRENGKSFWYNAGHQIKSSVMYVYDHSKEALSDANAGIKDKQ